MRFDMNSRSFTYRSGCLTLSMLITGCSLAPNYQSPSAKSLGIPPAYAPPVTKVDQSTLGRSSSATVEDDLATWWRTFNDPLLTGLVARAAASNLRIAGAAARLRQAREALIQAQSDRLPSLGGSAGLGQSFTYRRSSRKVLLGTNSSPESDVISGGSVSTGQLTVGVDASWQADLFDGLARSVEAASNDAEASAFNLEDVRTSIAAEVATNYIYVRLAQARLQIAHSSLSAQDDNLQLAKWRVQAGLVSSLDVEQARTQRAQTAAQIPAIETSYGQAVARLSTLTGQAPGALRLELQAPRTFPSGALMVPLGIPAETLRRRPDVRSAERQLAAATARVGVAKAALFPALAISGSISTNATGFGNLGNLLTGGLFANVAQAIFDGGRRNSQVRAARAGVDLAFANYKQIVLSGLEEVEDAVQTEHAATVRKAELTTSVNSAVAAAAYAQSQYRTGLIDALNLLQSESSLLAARDELALADADHSLALVQLYLALGGGWRPELIDTNERTR